MTPAPTVPAELLEVVKAARALLEEIDRRAGVMFLAAFDHENDALRTALANLDRINP